MPWTYFDLQPGNLLKKIFIKKTMEISIFISEKIIVPSEYAKNILIDKLSLDPKKISVVWMKVETTPVPEKERGGGGQQKDQKVFTVHSCFHQEPERAVGDIGQ